MHEKITVIRKTEPGVCGGTDAYRVDNAPKQIRSTEMIFFHVTSVLYTPQNRQGGEYGFVSAFAAPAGGAVFLFLEIGEGFSHRGERSRAWALVRSDLFPVLTGIVSKHAIARNNGFHSETHGLPENFGGSIDIRYASGERIGISDNQSPILGYEAGREIVAAFTEAMRGEAEELPDLSELSEIRFEQRRGGGGYTKATLKINETGEGVNEKSSRYDSPTVYESQKPVDAETVKRIKETVSSCGLLAWEKLPASDYKYREAKTMTFVFAGGREITVTDDRMLPGQINRGFFDVELELTTRH